ncbi:MAG: Uma2 family endonuclease [Clostridiales bacterium]|jgi:Uma2 family endonuclease|nr:Uma2 family endonuclease [Clostridiales bacterium]
MTNLAEKAIETYADEMKKELIDGIWYMSPGSSIRHHDVVSGIYSIFRKNLKGKNCKPFIDNPMVHFSNDNILVPDVMIVCNKDIIKDDAIYGAPDLIVEVLSPSTTKRDRADKMNVYEKYGVKEYWIVDPKSKSVEVYWLEDGKYCLNNAYVIHSDHEMKYMTNEQKAAIVYKFKTSLFDDFTIDIREVFEDID